MSKLRVVVTKLAKESAAQRRAQQHPYMRAAPKLISLAAVRLRHRRSPSPAPDSSASAPTPPPSPSSSSSSSSLSSASSSSTSSCASAGASVLEPAPWRTRPRKRGRRGGRGRRSKGDHKHGDAAAEEQPRAASPSAPVLASVVAFGAVEAKPVSPPERKPVAALFERKRSVASGGEGRLLVAVRNGEADAKDGGGGGGAKDGGGTKDGGGGAAEQTKTARETKKGEAAMLSVKLVDAWPQGFEKYRNYGDDPRWQSTLAPPLPDVGNRFERAGLSEDYIQDGDRVFRVLWSGCLAYGLNSDSGVPWVNGRPVSAWLDA